jgi:hypothetical protein
MATVEPESVTTSSGADTEPYLLVIQVMPTQLRG